MADQWYLARNNQKHGPYSSAQLQEFAKTGQLQLTDMLWKEGLAKWITASQVKGLFPQPNPQTVPQAIPLTPQPVPAASPLPAQPVADPFQELGGGSPGKAPATSPFVSKARAFFTTNWTTKKIAIVGGSAAGVCLLLVILVVALSGGGSTPNVPKLDFAKGPNGEEVFKIEEKNRVFMAFRDKAKKPVRHGLFTEFHGKDKSKKKVEGNFFAGEWHGKVTKWYDTGELYSERTYDRGKAVGTHKGYKKNGQVAWELGFDSNGLPLFKNASTDAFVNQLAEFRGRDRWEITTIDGFHLGDVLFPKNRTPPFKQYTFKHHHFESTDLWSYSALVKWIGPPARILSSPKSSLVERGQNQIWMYECKDGIVRFVATNWGILKTPGREDTNPQLTDDIGCLGVYVGGDSKW